MSTAPLIAGLAPASAASSLAPLSCPISAVLTVPCYGPPHLRAAYDVPGNATGSGRTIVIIDGFQSPIVATDLAGFDAMWGLATAHLKVVPMEGLPPFDHNSAVQRGWVSEQSVDVEWAHALAPGANIVLVEAKSGDDPDLLSATKYAIDHNLGDVISMSFSEAESCPTREFLADEHAAFRRAVEKGITLIAASGDNGAAERTCNGSLVAGVATPASDPLVTAVGGTRLTTDSTTGAYQSEVAWGDPFGASGGGFSTIYRRPGYQAPFAGHRKSRGLPDVAWSADLIGATLVRINGKTGPIVGTSAGTAAWAGIAALADEAAGHRLGSLNRTLYRIAHSEQGRASFHDITSGNNSFHGFSGFSAGPGWDPVTGLGTPDVGKLVSLLKPSAEDQGQDD